METLFMLLIVIPILFYSGMFWAHAVRRLVAIGRRVMANRADGPAGTVLAVRKD